MRKIKEPEAHRARAAVVDGNYPEGMRVRCSWCQTVVGPTEGEFRYGRTARTGTANFFKCQSCLDREDSESAA